MANYQFQALKAEYAQKWANMDISPNRVLLAQQQASKIVVNRTIYEGLQAKTNVPWHFIGLLHLRESNCNFGTHLHNGDPLTARTVHVPVGYPRTGTAPFSFEYSAIDALKLMGYTAITDWSIERIAYCFEKYNGFGYRKYNVPSAYLWASSNQYTKGKFVRDGVFNGNVVDKQLGAMVVLKCLLDLIQEPVAQIETTQIQDLIDEQPNTPTANVQRPTNKEMSEASFKWKVTDILHWIFGGSAVGGVSLQSLDAANITTVKNYTDAAKEFIDAYGFVLFLLLCGAGTALVMILRSRMKTDVQEGRSTPSGKVEQ